MAIKALTWMVQVFEAPVYCYHEIVHNAAVVAAFERAGVVFVDDIGDVPEGRPIMLSAHGSSPEVVTAATDRAAVMIDAVCPLVTKVHHEVRRMASEGYDIIYVGHEGHDEAVGAIAEAPEAAKLVDPRVGLGAFAASDDAKVALLAQTTLGLYEWEGVLDSATDRYPQLWTARKSDLCYATTNRQLAIQKIKMAMAVVGKNRHYRWNEIRRAHWLATAEECRFPTRDAEAIIDDCTSRVAGVIDDVAAALPSDFPSQVADPIFDGLRNARRRIAT